MSEVMEKEIDEYADDLKKHMRVEGMEPGVANMLRFIEAIEKDEDLEFIGDGISTNADMITAEDGKEYQPDMLFVLRDKRYGVEDARAFPKVEIKEIMEKCTPRRHVDAVERSEQTVRMAKGDENSIILQGITRIVGYYSRVNSWNKSKVGELRDRGQGTYWANKEEKIVDERREKAVNAL